MVDRKAEALEPLLLPTLRVLIAMPLIACIQAATYNMLFVTTNSRCQTCGYDLQGAAGLVCPECGTPISPVPAA